MFNGLKKWLIGDLLEELNQTSMGITEISRRLDGFNDRQVSMKQDAISLTVDVAFVRTTLDGGISDILTQIRALELRLEERLKSHASFLEMDAVIFAVRKQMTDVKFLDSDPTFQQRQEEAVTWACHYLTEQGVPGVDRGRIRDLVRAKMHQAGMVR